MAFLIGVIILIIFIVFIYLFLKYKIKKLLNRTGLSGLNIKDIVESARIEDQEIPKSLSSMDSLYLEQIKRDFIDINIDELKRMAEKVILDCYRGIEKKDSSGLNGKIKSFVDMSINDFTGEDVQFNNFKFHNTVVSKYEKENGVATIFFSSSFEYYLVKDGKNKKVQDRARVEAFYTFDLDKVSDNEKTVGINCPNCGSPINSLGAKKCKYCGSEILEIVGRVFTFCDIVRY